jgi:hypothetical protein
MSDEKGKNNTFTRNVSISISSLNLSNRTIVCLQYMYAYRHLHCLFLATLDSQPRSTIELIETQLTPLAWAGW